MPLTASDKFHQMGNFCSKIIGQYNHPKEIKSDARKLSTIGFKTDGWYPTSIPTTVLAALIANKSLP